MLSSFRNSSFEFRINQGIYPSDCVVRLLPSTMKRPVLLALLILASATVHGESPLAKARAKFQAIDAALNEAYAAAIGELDKPHAAALREDEREWIGYRDEMVDADFATKSGPSQSMPDYWEELADYESERITFLRAYSGKHVPRGITGQYDDAYGGLLDLTESKGGITFYLVAVRGHAHNNGEISGTISFAGNVAHFKEKLDSGETGPACELAFKRLEGHIIQIDEKVPDSDAGMGVHYDGTYYKISAKAHVE